MAVCGYGYNHGYNMVMIWLYGYRPTTIAARKFSELCGILILLLWMTGSVHYCIYSWWSHSRDSASLFMARCVLSAWRLGWCYLSHGRIGVRRNIQIDYSRNDLSVAILSLFFILSELFKTWLKVNALQSYRDIWSDVKWKLESYILF